MENVVEVCKEMGLEVEDLSLKECGKFAHPMKETVRAFNRSEDDPKTVTIVLDKNDIANMKMASTIYNRRLNGESVGCDTDEEDERTDDAGLIFCNGVVHAWTYVKSKPEWRAFLRTALQRKSGCARSARRLTYPRRRLCRAEYAANGSAKLAQRN